MRLLDLLRGRSQVWAKVVVPNTVRILMPDGTVQVMMLEEYLRGVVPVEIGRTRPLEAQKAQAIAARTYASTTRAHSAQGADLCTTQHCQVWRNVSYATSDLAVAQTRGQVAVYGGEMIRAFYFAHCDGQTRNVEDVWREALPYLRGVPCICGFTSMYGHGVGMCQEGACAMASQGFLARDIIAHYYTGAEVLGDAPPTDTSGRQAAIARYLVSHPDASKFLGASIPGGFLAADNNWIEFFEAGALTATPDGVVTLGPVGAWIAGLYQDRGSRPFLPAVPKPGVDGRYVDRTRHNVSRFYLRHWQPRWGDPVSEEFYIVIRGEPTTHQMFEYALISHDSLSNQPLRSTRLSEVFLSLLDGGIGLTLLGDFVA